jgi:phosphoglycolate phosphatase-like HAD superfamily hydrolase
MTKKAAVTVLRSQEELRRLWAELRPDVGEGADVMFKDAPGDRGTEIHVDAASAHVRDELRRFKARVETGRVPVSEATPVGERVERKLKQRPAQPLDEHELEEVGLR